MTLNKSILLILLSLSYLKLLGQDNHITKIEFQSVSRVYYENMIITADSLVVTKKVNRATQKTTTKSAWSGKEWRLLLKDLKTVDLAGLPKLASPTQKRTYDGAKHSRLTIHDGATTYEHHFDDENPHPVLLPVMNCIKRIRQR